MTEQTYPIDQSRSGHNSYVLRCKGTQVAMLYAGCLARLGAIDTPGVKVPADWNECERVRSCGNCEATRMRDQELTAGKALFFVPRASSTSGSMKPAQSWAMPSLAKKEAPAPAPTPSAPGSLIDLVGRTETSYAAALNAVVLPAAAPTTPTPAPAAAAPAPKSSIVAMPGESPLQMARRLAAERQASQTATA